MLEAKTGYYGETMEMKNSHERVLALLLEHIRDHAVIELDAKGQVQNWNRSLGRVFGYAAEDMAGQSLLRLFPATRQSPDRVTEMLEAARRRGSFEEDGEFQRRNGQTFRAHTVVLHLAETDHFIAVIRDLAVLMASRDQLHALATADQLTGLANRQHIFDLGRVEYRRWKRYHVPLSLMLVDIDGFSALNAKYGETVGDSILRDLASIVRRTVRDVDLVARVENDTFAALLFSTPPEGAATLAERLRVAVNTADFAPQGVRVKFTVSLAAGTANNDAQDFDQFYEQVEKALTKAKARDGDCIEIV